MDVAGIKQEVKRRYGAFAEGGGHRESCCARQPEPQGEPASAAGFAMDQGLYSGAGLSLVPDIALDLSRGCGNPTSFAALAHGEVVVDFGCGGGIDVILAAHKVGPEGRVLGRDLTPPMIERARQAVAKAGLEERKVDLEVADMSDTGLPDASADVVISNCAINLVPDKDAVYREAARILRPGGRLAISDIILSEPIDPDLAQRFHAEWTGCMGGALPEADYLELVHQAGFAEPEIVSRHVLSPEELEALARCPDEGFTKAAAKEDLAAVTGKVASIKFRATLSGTSGGAVSMDGGVEVWATAHKGEGVFATRSFRTVETVMVGVIARVLDHNHSHASQVGEDRFVLFGGLIPKINHSCEPNCGIRPNPDGGHDFVARQPIAAGEEILFDYAMRNYSVEHFPARCGCGSRRCRGRITGWKDLPPERKADYEGFVAPYLIEIDNRLS